ncbi:hypothetical protein [Allorhodopirellula heiligendammensis]|uniref:Uncharacterized protein n=1 Tax=Allorhodopirellula heiligendammensis TaxID=2714739 RepID=A0A5C6B1N4_9BACT|nr:hypothetical protein [Allorhodopirellula heiligendammensis]TWU05389.1 hypothetical protein Poly21_57060 [Allorhodopirellula heiligendammensis]
MRSLLASGGYLIKLVAHDTAVRYFPHTTEHCDAKLPGLSYEHDSAGNALASMVKPGLIEFRHHRSFSDARVRMIARRIMMHPDSCFTALFTVTYQGRTLIAGA